MIDQSTTAAANLRIARPVSHPFTPTLDNERKLGGRFFARLFRALPKFGSLSGHDLDRDAVSQLRLDGFDHPDVLRIIRRPNLDDTRLDFLLKNYSGPHRW